MFFSQTGSQRAFIIIGDSRPHEVEEYYEDKIRQFAEATESIDWGVEADKLLESVKSTPVNVLTSHVTQR